MSRAVKCRRPCLLDEGEPCLACAQAYEEPDPEPEEAPGDDAPERPTVFILHGIILTILCLLGVTMPPPLFSMETVTVEAPRTAQLLTLYGPPKIGKTILICSIPALFLICPEDGLANIPRPAPRFPRSPRTLQELYQAIDEFGAGNRRAAPEQRFRHLAIDSLSWVELMIHQVARAQIRRNNLDEEFRVGWGAVAGIWDNFFERLLEFRRRAGVHVWLVAHGAQRQDATDDGDTFPKWDLEIDKKAAPLCRKLSDHVLFMNWSSRIVKGKGKRTVGAYTGRLIHYRESAKHFAGSRSGAPEMTPAEWRCIEQVLAAGAPTTPEKLRGQIAAILPALEDADRADVEKRLAAAKTPRELAGVLSAAQAYQAALEQDDEERDEPPAPAAAPPPVAPPSEPPADEEEDVPAPALGGSPAAAAPQPSPTPAPAPAAPAPPSEPPADEEAHAQRLVDQAQDAAAIGKAFVALSKLKSLSGEARARFAELLRTKKASLAS